MSYAAIYGSLSFLLTSPLSPPSIFHAIFHYLSLRDLIRFSWTCKGAQHTVHEYKKHGFSINRILKRFFDDPCTFRAMQACTGMLISGSQALQFFCRANWSRSDLDLYICNNHDYILQVGQWIQRQGFVFMPYSSQDSDFASAVLKMGVNRPKGGWQPQNPNDNMDEQPYSSQDIAGIFPFEKDDPGLDEVLSLQIIVPCSTTLSAILDFHSTAVMNFISWEKAYSLYPYATLEKARSLCCGGQKRPSPRYTRAMVKYRNRGFTMVVKFDPNEDPRCAFRLGPRFVGDKDACVMPLDTEGIKFAYHLANVSTNFDQYLSNGWELRQYDTSPARQNDPWRDATHFKMKSSTVESSLLRHIYTAPLLFYKHVLPLIGKDTPEHIKSSPSDIKHAQRDASRHIYWKYYDKEYAKIVRQWMNGISDHNIIARGT